MIYPQHLDYNEAVQEPHKSFNDIDLRKGKVEKTPLELPVVLSGGFALTYPIIVGGKKFAVRCFHRPIPEIQNRYAAISNRLIRLNSPYFINFQFLNDGIKIKGKQYPIVKMDWVEGETLGTYLDRRYSDAAAVKNLRDNFYSLSKYLQHENVAHGDIQNLNVIVSNNALRLIDYDGMYVDGLQRGKGTEVGHKHFQHPLRGLTEFGPEIDRFSFIAIDVSLAALEMDRSLYQKYSQGGETIIFNASDFADPSNSEIFKLLVGRPALTNSVKNFAAICQAPFSQIPTLDDFRNSRNIPKAVAPITSQSASNTNVTKKYIAPYPVINGADYYSALKNVGNKIEVVGKIVDVKQGIGRHKRNKGRPYIFINFGNWQGSSVRLTIWADVLGNFVSKPDQSWVGKWVSATGLIDPPYTGKYKRMSYTTIGVTIASSGQINHLTEPEAKFRLGSPNNKSAANNADILSQILGDKKGIIPPINLNPFGWNKPKAPQAQQQQPQPKPAAPLSRNQTILNTIKGTTGGASTSSSSPNVSQPVTPPPNPIGASTGQPAAANNNKVSAWVWILGIIIVLAWIGDGDKKTSKYQGYSAKPATTRTSSTYTPPKQYYTSPNTSYNNSSTLNSGFTYGSNANSSASDTTSSATTISSLDQSVIWDNLGFQEWKAGNKASAAVWFRKAAEAGIKTSQSALGIMYLSGEGVPVDQIEGKNWLERAAAQNDRDALYFLGKFYLSDNPLGNDPTKAAELFLQAAEAGQVKAQNFIALLYIEGVGVSRDLKEARKWLVRAYETGDDDAKTLLVKLNQIESSAMPPQPDPFVASQENAEAHEGPIVPSIAEERVINLASFDCGSATTSLEVLICSNSILASLDYQQAALYQKTSSAKYLNARNRQKLATEHEKFLNARTSNCPIPFQQEVSELEAANVVSCLIEDYRKQIRVLQNKTFSNE